MKAFLYKEEPYIRCIPGKNLFKSTMVHDVVNRGDIFAIRIRDSMLTIIPGTAEVEHFDISPELIHTHKVINNLSFVKDRIAAEELEAKKRMFENFDKAMFEILTAKK